MLKELRKIKKGEYFTLREVLHPKAEQVYIRGEYIREVDRYECIKFNNINDFHYFKGSKKVNTDIIF